MADNNGAQSPNKQEGDHLRSEETGDSFLSRDDALGASMSDDEGDLDFGEGDDVPDATEEIVEGEEEGEKEIVEESPSNLSEADRQKIALVNAYNANPAAGLEQLARSLGYSLVRPGEEKKTVEAPSDAAEDVDLGELEWLKEPLSQLIKAHMAGVVRKSDLAPIQERLQENEQKSVETQLTELWPAWRTKEGEIREIIRVHPTMSLDLPKLVRLVWPGDATDAAKKVLKKGSTAMKTAGTKGTPSKTSPKKFNVMEGTFEQAFMKVADRVAADMESRGEL